MLTVLPYHLLLDGNCENGIKVRMTITLQPEHEKLIAQAMQTGVYQNPYEVIARALEILNSEDEWLRDHKPEIAEKIERAFGQFERGEFFSAEESRADMEKRKGAWLRERR
jgi:Arc/MetJ-type ribon-helix-helix transcriptional regulator